METIVPIKGNVKHTITLDPTVWIFDDRRLDLETYFTAAREEFDEMEDYKERMGKHWSREIMEGATYPPTIKTEKKYEKQKMLTGTFGILFEPFLKNAVPAEDASEIIFETADGEFSFPIEDSANLLFQFSLKGKPLKEDGPIHVMMKDGSMRNDPIRNVTGIRIS
ncbi:peptidyl-prolyl cis-trans isomerase [Sporosarcina aquimarina]|uniref:Peptidyl-prolyl cis-trans isomerase n=1 Tax=Sporosarcina aquimarina TaxID=114975 RepID=A0ABU4FXC7_9BACL|nr:peptidyl-prolyl cis-trans isomerase [Sporosarcina aquimarina]MDW0109353.1 peptidyl-prolyl cis-trans isomerase [Sporosarcina aquimarina]